MYTITFAESTVAHLKAIDKKHYSLIKESIEKLLINEPLAPTKNRKPLERESVFGDAWEIRFGPKNIFRVFYQVNEETNEVTILAIGTKKGNTLTIGGEVIDL